MARERRSAEEIRDELTRVAKLMSVDGEAQSIEFDLPIQADAGTSIVGHNWDVTVHCPEGLEDIATNAVIEVAERWDLD
jgi:hypothetical protein